VEKSGSWTNKVLQDLNDVVLAHSGRISVRLELIGEGNYRCTFAVPFTREVPFDEPVLAGEFESMTSVIEQVGELQGRLNEAYYRERTLTEFEPVYVNEGGKYYAILRFEIDRFHTDDVKSSKSNKESALEFAKAVGLSVIAGISLIVPASVIVMQLHRYLYWH